MIMQRAWEHEIISQEIRSLFPGEKATKKQLGGVDVCQLANYDIHTQSPSKTKIWFRNQFKILWHVA